MNCFTAGRLNDLWMYNLQTGWWVWLSGGQVGDQPGVYGSLGVSADENVPGGRFRHSMAIDYVNRLIYIFGGLGQDSRTLLSPVGISTIELPFANKPHTEFSPKL